MEVCRNEDMDVDILNCTNDDEDVDVDIVNFTNDDEDVGVDIINCKNDNEDVEVDIINCTDDDECDLVQPQYDDATASSSSFDDTYPDVGNCEYGNDNEVMSEFRWDAAQMPGYSRSADEFPVRKKRVTSHWRKFVQPIMWRCKWVELQLRKFQSLANAYDKELENYNQTKHLQYGNFELDGRCAKAVPFFHDSQRKKPMKREIRRRHEETDKEVFMSQHNLFSYFATCRSPPPGLIMDDDQRNLAPAQSAEKNVGNNFRVLDHILSHDFEDDYSLEQLLLKIEVSQSRVFEMKNRLNSMMTDNAGRISSAEDLVLQESRNALTCCSIREFDFPTNMDGPSVVADFASQLMKLNASDDLVKSDDDLVKPENKDSGHGEGTHLEDVSEPTEQLYVASRKRSTDGILIYNRRKKKTQTDVGVVKIHPIENLQVPKEEKSNSTAPVSVSEDSSQNEQPAPKLRSVSKLTAPRNKKKRAARTRRKSASSLWSRRISR